MRRLVLTRGNTSTAGLNYEGPMMVSTIMKRIGEGEYLQDVKQDEVESEPPSLDSKQSSSRGEVEDHTAHNHVYKGIGPKRRNLGLSIF